MDAHPSTHATWRTTRPARLIAGASVAGALFAAVLFPVPARAITTETAATLTETQKKVEETASAFETATKNLDALQAQIDENEAKIAEIESQLPAVQEKASKAMREMYKYKQGSNPLMSFVLKSQSLDDFITTVKYMDQIQSASNDAVEKLDDMQSELESQKAELAAAKAQAESQKQAASDALAEAQKVRSEAQAKADAEAAAELAALQAQQDTSAAEGTGTDGGNEHNTANVAGQTVTTPANTGVVNWDMGYDEFIAEWSGRIDAYLAGSPLAGHGADFAAAAWTAGVDPRWSPAIACIESTKGQYCANSYNAWGWTKAGGGFRAFGSWSEGISAHVSYLREMYGTTLTAAAAKRYCPPTWQDWYNKVASQMNLI